MDGVNLRCRIVFSYEHDPHRISLSLQDDDGNALPPSALRGCDTGIFSFAFDMMGSDVLYGADRDNYQRALQYAAHFIQQLSLGYTLQQSMQSHSAVFNQQAYMPLLLPLLSSRQQNPQLRRPAFWGT